MTVRGLGALAALLVAGSAGAASGDFILQIGGPGSGPGELAAPWGVAVDQDGSLYVADTGNHRVQVFSRTGAFLRSWGSLGAAPGQLDGPTGIAVCSGNVYVADTNNGRIQRFDGSGNLLAVYGGLSAPHGLACDDLYLYVADTGNHRVLVYEWDDYGFPPPAIPNGGHGSGPDQWDSPTAIALGPGGTIYVADTGNDRVLAVGVGYIGTSGAGEGQLEAPAGIAVDSGGNVFVADRGNSRLQVFGAAGAFVAAYGAPGAGPGQLAGPSGLAFDGGGRRVVVADTGNDRLQALEAMSADVAVTGFSVPAGVELDQPFTAGATVRNLGPGASGSVLVNARLPSVYGRSVCSAVVGLAPGEERTLALPCTWPYDLGPGAYTLELVVSNLSGVLDPDPTNGTATVILRVNGPDVVASGVVASGTGTTPGTITVGATVTNQGIGSAGPSKVRFALVAGSATGAFAAYLGDVAVDPLAPGIQQTIGGTFAVPGNLTPGSYVVRAYADWGGVLRETSEANNTAHSAPFPIGGPDLVLAAGSVPPSIRQGETGFVMVTVLNQGPGATSVAFSVAVVLTRDGGVCFPTRYCDESDDDWWLGGIQVPAGLAAGAQTTLTIPVTIPADLEPLPWNAFAVVDSGRGVRESNESNNISFLGAIRVEPASTTLVVGIDIRPGSYPNSINLGSNGNVPVAILSTPTFDASTVDPLTVTLESAPVVVRGNGTPSTSLEDVNADGLLDLVVHVETQGLKLTTESTEAVLQGRTRDGVAIAGSDTVNVVP
jgi:sugar lactone lactonase YvrE